MFRKEAPQIPDRLQADLQRYIDAYFRPPQQKRYAVPPFAGARKTAAEADVLSQETAAFAPGEICAAASDKKTAFDLGLQVDEPFSLKLLRLIDRKGMRDVTCYKKANVSRQTWYKIMNESGYRPNKKTVLSFAVALELTLEETQALLESAGFVLSQSSLFDVILMYCLSHGIYDAATIDSILFRYDQETLYSKA